MPHLRRGRACLLRPTSHARLARGTHAQPPPPQSACVQLWCACRQARLQPSSDSISWHVGGSGTPRTPDSQFSPTGRRQRDRLLACTVPRWTAATIEALRMLARRANARWHSQAAGLLSETEKLPRRSRVLAAVRARRSGLGCWRGDKRQPRAWPAGLAANAAGKLARRQPPTAPQSPGQRTASAAAEQPRPSSSRCGLWLRSGARYFA